MKPKSKQPGFNSVMINIAGIDKYAGYIVVARAQNEIYAVLSDDDRDVKMYACTPDSISMVDPTTGMTITVSMISLNDMSSNVGICIVPVCVSIP